MLGGATGLGGIPPTLWCVLRGWPRDEHRAVSQPTAVATFALTLMAFGGLGLVTPETTRLFLIGLPVLVAGTLLGWSLYGKLDEGAFRKVVLVLLLVSGLAIVVTGRRLPNLTHLGHLQFSTPVTLGATAPAHGVFRLADTANREVLSRFAPAG